MSAFVDKGPYIMGVINVTPDSFSDGGSFLNPDKAVEHGFILGEQGADILDIGGESTRPGAEPVSPQEEMDRVLPVIEGLKECGCIISIDTRHPKTMAEAVKAGATMINDVTALRGDDASLAVAADSRVPVCLMHMKGNPENMQDNPEYDDVVAEIYDFFVKRIDVCQKAGISKNHIVIDPGIGFGKTLAHNLAILRHIGRFKELGVPVLLGLSRKSFIEKLCPNTPADQRLPGSLAGALWALEQGVNIFRVHDAAETKQAFTVFQAIKADL